MPHQYLTSVFIYNLYFHPLAKFPGPLVWSVARLPFVRAMQTGTLVHQIALFHAKYGPIVRVAPDELSFIDHGACRDIYAARNEQPRFPKNPVWMGNPIPRRSSIVDANDEDHARIRGVWSHNFTRASLKRQEPLMNVYINKLIEKLRAQGDGASVEIVQWFNFLTFDLTGDLAFGESFNCLETGTFHPWIEKIFSHFKSATLLASIRFYPSLFGALMYLLPASVLRKQQEHFQMAREKVQRRLNLEKERPDFLQCVLEHQSKDGDPLTEAEIEKTAATMIVAGSETTGTCLAGILNHVLKDRQVKERLVREIRAQYSSSDDIDEDSLARLPYLGAIIQEGLRIAPPVPTGMPRVVPAGGAQVCGHWLPANPFSMGPRNCVGQRLALMQVRLILAKLFYHFDVDAVEGRPQVEWAKQKVFTLWEKEPGWVTLRVRKNQK
ncbi:MAG: hypothetical protein Q9192_002597 [Flavoplaca navasiana]